MRALAIVLLLCLGACASMPQAKVYHKRVVTPPPPVVVMPTTPNEVVKHRWYDRFKKHPRWVH